MTGVSTCLWFDGTAAEAARFYVDTFRALGREAEMGALVRQAGPGPNPDGAVLLAPFTLEGHAVMGLNGGAYQKLTPAASLVVRCADQDEVDRAWDALVAGGEPVQCGWLTDRYGVSWQIVPDMVMERLNANDPAASARMMAALVEMVKLDIAKLQTAYEGTVTS